MNTIGPKLDLPTSPGVEKPTNPDYLIAQSANEGMGA